MNKEKIIIQLGVEIDIYKAHVQRLRRDNKQLHQLDIDVLREKTRKLYDLLFELEETAKGNPLANKPQTTTRIQAPSQEEVKKSEHIKKFEDKQKDLAPSEAHKTTNEIKPKVKTDISPEPTPKKEVVPERTPNILKEEKPEIKHEVSPEPKIEPQPKPPVEVKLKPEPKLEPTPSRIRPEERIQHKPEPKPVPETPIEKPVEIKSTFDLFSDSAQSTISDKFTDKGEKSLADKMQQTPVTDLRQSIGINEKFLFINELFNGDMGKYNKVINELNEMITLKGALTFLMETKIEKQWNDELPAFIKLKALIERKFI